MAIDVQIKNQKGNKPRSAVDINEQDFGISITAPLKPQFNLKNVIFQRDEFKNKLRVAHDEIEQLKM